MSYIMPSSPLLLYTRPHHQTNGGAIPQAYMRPTSPELSPYRFHTPTPSPIRNSTTPVKYRTPIGNNNNTIYANNQSISSNSIFVLFLFFEE